ncbi:hypothetical protein ACIBCM_32340 [Streptomyces sp. NPDC051018]|uniref:hypothetical protein n=1 Tax=Streptomyces sp. NPDC051018 TaxID=3365639 RepID=UPI0037918A86
MMKIDCWHQWRYLRLEGMDFDEYLPFGTPPYVIGGVIRVREPTWMSVAATVCAQGTEGAVRDWLVQGRGSLPVAGAVELLGVLPLTIADVMETGNVVLHPQLVEDDRPPPETVLTVLRALCDLLAYGVERESNAITWVE